MMKSRTFMLGGLVAAVSGALLPAQRGKTAELRQLVYELVDPDARPFAQEKLLRHGKRAVPILLEAIQEGDIQAGGRRWSDQNRHPKLANKQASAIRQEAVIAALHVLQEMRGDAVTAFDPLFERMKDWSYSRSEAAFQNVLGETVMRLGVLSGRDRDLRERFAFRSDPRIAFDEQPTLATLVRDLCKFSGGDRKRMSPYVACCYRLELRWQELAQNSDLRKRTIEWLERVVSLHEPDPNYWPTVHNTRGWYTQRAWHTVIHDRGSLLLARIAPGHPQAVRGNMILLVSLRSNVRHQAALHLGHLGAKAAPATHSLLRCLQDPVPRVRQMAVTSLGMIGKAAKAAIPALRKLVLSGDKRLKLAAKAALRHVDPNPSELWTYYHFNGEKQAEGKCDDAGRMRGAWTHWNREGKKEWAGSYVAGKMHGVWTQWTKAGAVRHTYEHGRYLGALPSKQRRSKQQPSKQRPA